MVSLSLNKLKLDIFIIFIYLYLILCFYGTIRITDESITLKIQTYSELKVTITMLKQIIVRNMFIQVNIRLMYSNRHNEKSQP